MKRWKNGILEAVGQCERLPVLARDRAGTYINSNNVLERTRVASTQNQLTIGVKILYSYKNFL